MQTATGTYTIEEALTKSGFGKFHWWLLLLAGLINIINASTVLLLTFLIPIVEDIWDLASEYDFLIGVSFFMGELVGNFVFAKLSDIYGRKTIVRWQCLIVACSFLATAYTSNVGEMLVTYAIIGFGNSTVVITTLFLEFVPSEWRTTAMILFQLWWTAGGIYMVLVAWVTLTNFDEDTGWKVYILITCFPILIGVLCSLYIPESIRWLCTVGEYDKAEKQIQQIFKTNGMEPMKGQLERRKTITERGKLKDAFVPKYKITSTIMIMNFFVGAVSYYMIVMASERLFEDSSLYLFELVTTLGEIPAIPFGFLMDKIGRKRMMIITRSIPSTCLAMVAILWYYNSTSYQTYMVILIFFARGTQILNFMSMKLFIIEYYPTAIRTTVFGFVYALTRFGGCTGMFIAEDLDIVTGLVIVSGISMLSVALVISIPEDTMNKEMTNSVDRVGARSSSRSNSSTDSITKGKSSKEYVLASQ